MAHDLMVESLRAVSATPITEDELKRRIAAVDASAAKADVSQVLNWARCYLGHSLEGDADSEIRAPFIKADSVFPRTGATELIRTLTGEILVAVLERKDNLSTTIALLLACNPRGGATEPVSHLRPAAASYLEVESVEVRLLNLTEAGAPAKLKLAGGVNASSDLTEVATFVSGMPTLIEAINKELAAVRVVQNRLLHNQEILSEETQSLWWFLSQGTESGSIVDAKTTHPNGYLFLLGAGLARCIKLLPPPASLQPLMARYLRALRDEPAAVVEMGPLYAEIPEEFMRSGLESFYKTDLGTLAVLLNAVKSGTNPSVTSMTKEGFCLQLTKELLLARLVEELNGEE